MRLLDRYLFRELLVPLGFCLAAFLIFWITFDVFGQLDHFQDHQWTLGDIGEYYFLKLPELLNIVLPVSLLLALLYALTQHSRYNELIAMRAAGLSLWRICAPYFLLGLLFCAALSAINEQFLTDAPQRLEQLERRRLEPATGMRRTRWRERVDFRNSAAGRQWSLGAFNLDTTELWQPRVAMYLPVGAHREITSETAVWTNGYWLMPDGRERIFRREDDPSPAEAAVRFFRPADMGGGPTNLAQWTGTPVVVSNTVVGMTNLSRLDEATKRSWTAQSLSLSNGVMAGFRFTQPLELGSNRRIIAKGGYWTNGQWRFLGVNEWIYRYKTDGEPMMITNAVLDAPEFDESPSMIRSEIRLGEILSKRRLKRPELPIRDILGYMQLHPQIPRDQMNQLQTQLHARIAAPWTCLVVVLIAVPFGAPSGRRNIFYGVAGSLAWGFLYFTVQQLGFALGQNGTVPPWLGAWLPNATFGTLGLWLMSRVR